MDIIFENPTSVATRIPEEIGKYLNEELELNIDCLSVHFLSDEAILSINKHYLNHDYYTDIITFDLRDDLTSDVELFISVERIEENSVANKISFMEELSRIIIHGMLHVKGYTDQTLEEKTEMSKMENYYLDKLFHVKHT